jgi:hypothetical protein
MCLLHLVKKDDAVWMSSDFLGQLSTVFMANKALRYHN